MGRPANDLTLLAAIGPILCEFLVICALVAQRRYTLAEVTDQRALQSIGKPAGQHRVDSARFHSQLSATSRELALKR